MNSERWRLPIYQSVNGPRYGKRAYRLCTPLSAIGGKRNCHIRPILGKGSNQSSALGREKATLSPKFGPRLGIYTYSLFVDTEALTPESCQA